MDLSYSTHKTTEAQSTIFSYVNALNIAIFIEL